MTDESEMNVSESRAKINSFGELLKQLRQKENMTLAAFAAKLGISAANLCDFEQGRKLPSPRRALAFGQILNLPEELMIEISLESSMNRDNLAYSVSVQRQGLGSLKGSPTPVNFEILVVEDNPRDIELTLRAFTQTNIDVSHIRVFRDGETVLNYLLDRTFGPHQISALPKLLLLDLKLPKMAGVEVLRRLKKSPLTCALPIVVLTSSAGETSLIESYQHGANGYIVKPVNFQKFAEAIGALGKYWVQVNQTPECQTTFESLSS